MFNSRHLFTVRAWSWWMTRPNLCAVCGKVEGNTHLPTSQYQEGGEG